MAESLPSLQLCISALSCCPSAPRFFPAPRFRRPVSFCIGHLLAFSRRQPAWQDALFAYHVFSPCLIPAPSPAARRFSPPRQHCTPSAGAAAGPLSAPSAAHVTLALHSAPAPACSLPVCRILFWRHGTPSPGLCTRAPAPLFHCRPVAPPPGIGARLDSRAWGCLGRAHSCPPPPCTPFDGIGPLHACCKPYTCSELGTCGCGCIWHGWACSMRHHRKASAK